MVKTFYLENPHKTHPQGPPPTLPPPPDDPDDGGSHGDEGEEPRRFSYEALLQLGGDLDAPRLSSPLPSGFKFNSQSSHAVWIQIKPPVLAPA